jgi:hypothetical protein
MSQLLKTMTIELLLSILLSTADWPRTQNPDQHFVKLLDVPPLTDAPITVDLALAITDLVDVDEAHEQFRVSGITIASWNDAQLAFNPRPGEKTPFCRQDQIWTPTFHMLNAVEPKAGLATIRV